MAPPKTAGAIRRRDAVLREELIDTLRHDVRTAAMTLEITLDGGVAHLRGQVDDESTRATVARLARRIEGINAVWDFVRLPGEEIRVVDIGCGGKKKLPWAIGIDRTAQPGVDIVADLEKGIPLPDASVDHVLAIHILEHIGDLLGLMDDIHRVLRPAGTLHVMTPDWRHETAIADPTHRRYMAVGTFRYSCEPHGHRLWEPLKVTSDGECVLADLRPRPHGSEPSAAGLARWFT